MQTKQLGTMGVNLVMTSAYVLPFGTGESPKSYHAICGINFSLDVQCEISPKSLYNPTHPAARQLWSTDVKAAERYMELVEQCCQADNIEKCVAKLVQRCKQTGICSNGDKKTFNANITAIMIRAENKCKRAKGHDWSPLLANAGRTVITAKWNLSNVMHRRSPIPINSSTYTHFDNTLLVSWSTQYTLTTMYEQQ
jgi:hypothetical protein